MVGQNIVCFAKDWHEQPTSNNHVMLELAKRNRVLWVNSVGTRTPSLRSGRDVGKIVRKIRSFFGGVKQVGRSMWVYTPLVLPFPHSRAATVVNGALLRLALTLIRHRLGMSGFQLWTFLPNVSPYIGRLGESLLVYYCVDEWAKFDYLDGERTAEAERDLCRRADVVFATAQSLVAGRRHLNPETHLAAHGVDHQQFSGALVPGTTVPDDLACLPPPVLGFYGTVQNWVDLRLIAFLAERHPEWTVVLVGDVMTDVSAVRGFRNVHLLGRRSHADLPRYCKGFAVGLIPYVLNERLMHVNPLKLREYLSAGLPVVSTALPEVEKYNGLCTVARNYEEFERGVIDALKSDSPELRRMRSDAMARESWEHRVADVCEKVARVQERRRRTLQGRGGR